MYCGCPLPVCTAPRPSYQLCACCRSDLHLIHQGDTIGQKLRQLVHHVLHEHNQHEHNQHEHKIPITLSPWDGNLLATHPSDHNSVYIDSFSRTQRAKRKMKQEKRRERDWQRILQGRMEKHTYIRGEGHSAGFLVPVPYYYSGGIVGCPGACAAVRAYSPPPTGLLFPP
jgi:hypothetical protein